MLWVKFLQVICWPLDLLLSFIEKLFSFKGAPEPYPTIFVIGIHRTGSTFVSQVLSTSLGFAPLGNLATIFPRSKFIVHRLFRSFYQPWKQRKRRKYRSFYGISRGIFAIGDSYEVWDRWFGNDHYNRPAPLSDEKKADMAAYFHGFQKAWGRPVITKNNRNTLVLEEIYNAIPNVFFVLVNRKPADVIQSTMQASKDFFGTDEIIWGLRNEKSFAPENYKDKLDAYCHQYLDLDDSIRKELNKLPAEDYAVIQYEDFCKDPISIQKSLLDKLRKKYELTGGEEGLGSSRYFKSVRLYDEELSKEINQRLRDIRTSKTD